MQRQIYNREIKSRFAEERGNRHMTAPTIMAVFRAAAPYEEAWGADMCTRPAADINILLEGISKCYFRRVSQETRFAVIKQYLQWCLDNSIEGAINNVPNENSVNAICEPSPDTEFPVCSPLQLQRYLNIIYEPESERTIDNLHRCYCWLAYQGLPKEEVPKITRSQVNYKESAIIHNEYFIPIYREALPAFVNATDLEEFVYKNPAYVSPIFRKRIDGDTLFRGVRANLKPDFMDAELSRKISQLFEIGKIDVRFSYQTLRLSGIFYRIYEREKAGFPVDFVEEVERNEMKGKTYVTPKYRANARNAAVRKYKKKYEQWKIYHNL